MYGDKNDLLIRTGSRERNDAVLYGILRLLTSSKTERKHLKKAARGKKRDARRIRKLTGEKSRVSYGAVLSGIGKYLLFGKEAFWREEASKERKNGRLLASLLSEAPEAAKIAIRGEKRARRDERYSGRLQKIAGKEAKKNEKRTARKIKRAEKSVKRYFKR